MNTAYAAEKRRNGEKMDFIYDIHVHCSENSHCSPCCGRDIARAYIRAGFTGIVMTNHFLGGHQTDLSAIDWEAEATNFMTGYLHAKEVGDQEGLDVFFGWEYNYQGADLLTYGLGLDWLLSHPDMCAWDISQYFRRVHEAGGYICHAHPFREASHIPYIQLFPRCEDAVEVFNGSHLPGVYDPVYNDRALWYARQYGLTQLAGSDTHGTDADGMPSRKASVRFDHRISSVREMIALFRSGDYSISHNWDKLACD